MHIYHIHRRRMAKTFRQGSFKGAMMVAGRDFEIAKCYLFGFGACLILQKAKPPPFAPFTLGCLLICSAVSKRENATLNREKKKIYRL